MERIAIIDVGTNTFNLLIADIYGKSYEIIHKSKLPVKLGQETIEDGLLHPNAINRGIKALKSHKKTIEKFKVNNVYAFATSAVRSAKNKNDFLTEVYKHTNINIEVISGDREAELIWHGAKNQCLENEITLIMDIGGGSIEFIIGDRYTIKWKKSYQLGISRIIDKFKPSDPISKNEIQKIEDYFLKETGDLFEAINKYSAKILLGTSGSFETIAQLIKHNTKTFSYRINAKSYFLHQPDYLKLHRILLSSTLAERKNMKGMELMRAEMMTIASIIMNILIKNVKFDSFYQTKNALREGALEILINKSEK
ncbi:MAG: hypothetical protein Kow0068_03620 [Marinilabiliales bacterium]